MDNIVLINNSKTNLLEFDLSVEGLNPMDINAKFVIRANNMEFAFECVNVGKNKWEVRLPELPILERTAYPFHFSVDADGYHFEPLKGTVNVVGSAQVYATAPKNAKIAPPKSATTIVEDADFEEEEEVKLPPVPKTRAGEKPIAQIAEELMASNAKKPAKVAPPKPKKSAIKESAITPYTPPESLLPKIDVEPRQTKPIKGEKDDVVLSILQEAGFSTKTKPKKSRFSIND